MAVSIINQLWVKGVTNKQVTKEIERLIEDAYPTKEGKIFIGILHLSNTVSKNPERYPILSGIATIRYRKGLLTSITTQIFGWELFNRSNHSGKPVVMRPEAKQK
jgi:hypothetical protein